jgi:hypothetical protein
VTTCIGGHPGVETTGAAGAKIVITDLFCVYGNFAVTIDVVILVPGAVYSEQIGSEFSRILWNFGPYKSNFLAAGIDQAIQ